MLSFQRKLEAEVRTKTSQEIDIRVKILLETVEYLTQFTRAWLHTVFSFLGLTWKLEIEVDNVNDSFFQHIYKGCILNHEKIIH